MIDDAYVRAGVLSGPLSSLKRHNISPSEMLKRSGLTAQALSPRQKLVGPAEYLNLLARCEYAFGSEHFMLQTGLEVPLDDLGVAAQAGLCAETLRDALSFVDELAGYVVSGGGLDISIARGRCQVRYRQGLASDHDARRDVEYSLGVLFQYVLAAKHAHDPDLRICYSGARSYLCLSRYGAPRFIDSTDAMIEFDARSLNCPMSYGHKDETDILSLFMDANRIDTVLELSVSEACESLIECAMEVRQPSQNLIASMLGMNARTMQRQLKAEGSTYREILESARRRVAMKELSKGSSITHIALKLGYEHPQNFTTAFDNWYGSAPSAVRSQKLLLHRSQTTA